MWGKGGREEFGKRIQIQYTSPLLFELRFIAVLPRKKPDPNRDPTPRYGSTVEMRQKKRNTGPSCQKEKSKITSMLMLGHLRFSPRSFFFFFFFFGGCSNFPFFPFLPFFPLSLPFFFFLTRQFSGEKNFFFRKIFGPLGWVWGHRKMPKNAKIGCFDHLWLHQIHVSEEAYTIPKSG